MFLQIRKFANINQASSLWPVNVPAPFQAQIYQNNLKKLVYRPIEIQRELIIYYLKPSTFMFLSFIPFVPLSPSLLSPVIYFIFCPLFLSNYPLRAFISFPRFACISDPNSPQFSLPGLSDPFLLPQTSFGSHMTSRCLKPIT